MRRFTPVRINNIRWSIENNQTSKELMSEMIDEIERLQARVRELEAECEQTCEWKQETSLYDNEKFYTSPHNQYDNVCNDYQMNKNVHCLTCGKRIKYAESEEE